jgi:hypothetical protein
MTFAWVEGESPGRLMASLVGLSEGVSRLVEAETHRQGLALLADVKRRAARPRTSPSVAGLGPRLQTGDYNRSIGLRVSRQGDTVVAAVGTNAVQGLRLELGFVGPGARTLPHPHFGPAFETAAPRFVAAIEAIVAEETGK